MALGDWNVYKDGGVSFSDPKGIVYTNIITPIIGAGSVRLTEHLSTTAFQSINLVPATIPTGYRAGRIQTLISLDDMISVSNAGHISHAGILCMQNIENLAAFGEFGGEGRAYGAAISIGNGMSSKRISLFKFTSGIDGSSGVISDSLLTSSAVPFTVNEGDTIALELEWRTEDEVIADLGGASLIVRVGQETDFSDLEDVIIYVDTDEPFITTLCEGIWAGLKTVTGAEAVIFNFDSTSIYRISIV